MFQNLCGLEVLKYNGKVLHTLNIQSQILSLIVALQQPKDPFLFKLKDFQKKKQVTLLSILCQSTPDILREVCLYLDVGDCAEDLVLYHQL